MYTYYHKKKNLSNVTIAYPILYKFLTIGPNGKQQSHYTLQSGWIEYVPSIMSCCPVNCAYLSSYHLSRDKK
ncbi:hypothetical protein EUGRSUZ_A01895 [Eucalyptus grandis]|uniref:Uncharacterized protein n=2 Tax=Eucalyptus grandis TaxID=71139 RepID=A0ACC3M4R1_EUCGR|nr:hypothetical protein EUGRSUZ_A01895 [Eucalyptus grandis]